MKRAVHALTVTSKKERRTGETRKIKKKIEKEWEETKKKKKEKEWEETKKKRMKKSEKKQRRKE